MIANQVLEGGIDSSLFENFLHHTLSYVAGDPELSQKQVVVFMDNAAIHKHEIVLETVRKFGAILIFNSEYSPTLNPVELWF